MNTRYENNPGLYDEYFEQLTTLLTNLKDGFDPSGTEYDDDSNPFYKYNDKGAPIQVSLETAKKSAEDILTIINKSKGINTAEDAKIENLEQYFGILGSLNEDINTKYRILPLDEPMFTINTDKRTIDFTSGTSVFAVKGDTYAETLYFIVDRYYDHVDLNNQNIMIEWDNGTKDGKGVIEESIRDLISEPGKIIFGWTITSDMTKNATNLKFAVRFYDYDDTEGFRYSLTTLPQTLPIKDSLNHDLKKFTIITPSERINQLIQNTDITNNVKVNVPVYYINLNTDLASGTDLEKPAGQEEYSKDLFVSAYSVDTGDISYSWYKASELSDNHTVDGIIEEYSKGALDYTEKVTNTYNSDLIKYKIYTDKDGNVLQTEDDVEDILGDGKDIYLLRNKCTVTKPGYYYCVARNTAGKNYKTLSSKYIWVPTPADIKINNTATTNITNYIIQKNASNGNYELLPVGLTIASQYVTENLEPGQISNKKQGGIIANKIYQQDPDTEKYTIALDKVTPKEKGPSDLAYVYSQDFIVRKTHKLNGEEAESSNYMNIKVYNPIDTPTVTLTEIKDNDDFNLKLTIANGNDNYLNPINCSTILERKIILKRYDPTTGSYVSVEDARWVKQNNSEENILLTQGLPGANYQVRVEYKIKDTVTDINTITGTYKESNGINLALPNS